MSWKKVGEWLKDNADSGVSLIGSLITGNIPGAIAAGSSLVISATGSDDPERALQALTKDPACLIKLKDLYYQNEARVMSHIEEIERLKLEDHRITQETIKNGDNSLDENIRKTRPDMAKQSWSATVAYCLGCTMYYAFTKSDIFNVYLAGFLSAPAWAYLGLRTWDKRTEAWKIVGKSK